MTDESVQYGRRDYIFNINSIVSVSIPYEYCSNAIHLLQQNLYLWFFNRYGLYCPTSKPPSKQYSFDKI